MRAIENHLVVNIESKMGGSETQADLDLILHRLQRLQHPVLCEFFADAASEKPSGFTNASNRREERALLNPEHLREALLSLQAPLHSWDRATNGEGIVSRDANRSLKRHNMGGKHTRLRTAREDPAVSRPR